MTNRSPDNGVCKNVNCPNAQAGLTPGEKWNGSGTCYPCFREEKALRDLEYAKQEAERHKNHTTKHLSCNLCTFQGVK